MTIQITKPEVEALIKRCLESGAFKDAEDLILQALTVLQSEESKQATEERRRAIAALRTFGKSHGLSLGGLSIRELRHEARP